MRGYLSQPETTGKVLHIIVIMEAFGVNTHIQEVADQCSSAGDVAVAPVLYHRLGCTPLFSHTGRGADVPTTPMGSLKIYPGVDCGIMVVSARTTRPRRGEIPWGGRSVGCRRACERNRCGIWGVKAPRMQLAWLCVWHLCCVERRSLLTQHGAIEVRRQ
jgi:Dienelactone hydrolase family